jgi:hypothetical protein
VADKKFAKKVADCCKALKPLNDFLMEAVA